MPLLLAHYQTGWKWLPGNLQWHAAGRNKARWMLLFLLTHRCPIRNCLVRDELHNSTCKRFPPVIHNDWHYRDTMSTSIKERSVIPMSAGLSASQRPYTQFNCVRLVTDDDQGKHWTSETAYIGILLSNAEHMALCNRMQIRTEPRNLKFTYGLGVAHVAKSMIYSGSVSRNVTTYVTF